MISGARIGQPTWLRRRIARAESRSLTAFAVPGPAIARAHALDLGAAGLSVVPSPRDANVLIVIGAVPEALLQSVAVAYAQMGRPRAILTVGAARVASLPAPDVAVALDQAALAAGVADLRRRFGGGAWAADAEAFAIEVAEPNGVMSRGGHDHHTMRHGAHGEMPAQGHERHKAGARTSQSMPMTEDEDARHAPAMEHDMPHGAMPMPMDHGGETGHDIHGDMNMPMDHNAHGMAMDMDMEMSGGFMSMVAMTKDLPRSRDGLPMEWSEAPFGPLFPGLPGGLALTLTLDGDTVAEAKVTPGMVHRRLAATWRGPAASFPERLASLDPFGPIAYRVLAARALENAAGVTIDDAVAGRRIGALEGERVASHLNWLVDFASLLGDRWLATRAAGMRSAFVHIAAIGDAPRVHATIAAFIRQARRTPFLRLKLGGVGYAAAPAGEDARGPFARAAGVSVDARADDPVYRDLGFVPVIHDGNDAWARLCVRLDEILQSLDLVRAVRSVALPDPPALPALSGTGSATVETARGPAMLHLMLQEGRVHHAHLDTPSARLVTLVPHMAKGHELADALVGIASLDLSPWEVDQ